jgi:hypothetical protein
MIKQFYEETPPDGAMLVIKITHYQDGHIEMKIIKAGDYSAPATPDYQPSVPATPEPHQNNPGTNGDPPAPFTNLQGIRGPGNVEPYDYGEEPDHGQPTRRIIGSSINVPPFNTAPPVVYSTEDLIAVVRSPDFKHWVRTILIPEWRRDRAFDEVYT